MDRYRIHLWRGECARNRRRSRARCGSHSTQRAKAATIIDYARDCGVRVMTENFKRLTQRAAPLLDILNRCDGKIGLCTDFGQFQRGTQTVRSRRGLAICRYDSHQSGLRRRGHVAGPISNLFGFDAQSQFLGVLYIDLPGPR